MMRTSWTSSPYAAQVDPAAVDDLGGPSRSHQQGLVEAGVRIDVDYIDALDDVFNDTIDEASPMKLYTTGEST